MSPLRLFHPSLCILRNPSLAPPPLPPNMLPSQWCVCMHQGVGLCHGISGNGYALLSLFRATGEQQYLRAARGFALYGAQHWRELYEVPDRPASLFEVRERGGGGVREQG